jgi:hypothetical protein
MTNRCGSCRFFQGSDALEIAGTCRRYAPRPKPAKGALEGGEVDLNLRAQWPTVHVEDFCGEFEWGEQA